MSIINALTPNYIAKTASKYGLEKLSQKILTRNYGEQFGKTSKSGLRAFSYMGKDNNQYIELIDKNFNSRGGSVISRYSDGTLKEVHKFSFNDGKTTNTSILRYPNPVSMRGGKKQDVKYVHYITEYGTGIKQRTGSWSICLPDGQKLIERNENHILDHLL